MQGERVSARALLDAQMLASSSAKSTPPTGAPNAAAKPTAAPIEMKSRRSASLWKRSASGARQAQQRRPPQRQTLWPRVSPDPAIAPVCTSGASTPTASPDVTAANEPRSFTTSVRSRRKSRRWTPLR